MGGEVPIELAGGIDAPEPALGTDAVRVSEAIERADNGDGVLVLMDLGSAVLSAEMALDLLPAERRVRVQPTEAPLAEGAVAAAVTAKLGASLEEVAAEARGALQAKVAHLGTREAEAPVSAASGAAMRPAGRAEPARPARPAGRALRPDRGELRCRRDRHECDHRPRRGQRSEPQWPGDARRAAGHRAQRHRARAAG